MIKQGGEGETKNERQRDSWEGGGSASQGKGTERAGGKQVQGRRMHGGSIYEGEKTQRDYGEGGMRGETDYMAYARFLK